MLTEYFKNLIANNLWHTAGDASSDIPATYYLALSSSEPKTDGTGVVEPSIASYRRKELTSLKTAVDGLTTNAQSITFDRFETADATPVRYWALFDASSGGHLLMGGQLDHSVHIDAGTAIDFPAGAISLAVKVE